MNLLIKKDLIEDFSAQIICNGTTAWQPVRARIKNLLDLLDKSNQRLGYRDLPAGFDEALRTDEFGKIDFQNRINLLMLELVLHFEKRYELSRLPEVFIPVFQDNINRILRQIITGSQKINSINDDIFLKDLGILRMTLIPCVSHLVFRNSGVPRRSIIQQPLSRIIQALTFFIRAKGFRPFMENHVHPAMLDQFNAQGREHCYRLIAELFRYWPECKGLMGSSWYYDPVVSIISPRLAYLRCVPEQNGALFLYAGTGPDVIQGSISKSSTRRQLFNEGNYQPRRYLMVWLREDIQRYCGV